MQSTLYLRCYLTTGPHNCQHLLLLRPPALALPSSTSKSLIHMRLPTQETCGVLALLTQYFELALLTSRNYVLGHTESGGHMSGGNRQPLINGVRTGRRVVCTRDTSVLAVFCTHSVGSFMRFMLRALVIPFDGTTVFYHT